MVRFPRKRSDETSGKRNVSADGNMWLPSCLRNVFTLSFHLRILEISSYDKKTESEFVFVFEGGGGGGGGSHFPIRLNNI